MENSTTISHQAATVAADIQPSETIAPAAAATEKIDRKTLLAIFGSAAAIVAVSYAIIQSEFNKQQEMGISPQPRKLSYSPISYLPQ